MDGPLNLHDEWSSTVTKALDANRYPQDERGDIIPVLRKSNYNLYVARESWLQPITYLPAIILFLPVHLKSGVGRYLKMGLRGMGHGSLNPRN